MISLLKFIRYSMRVDNTYWIDLWRRKSPVSHWLNTKLYHLGQYLQAGCENRALNSTQDLFVFSVCRNSNENGNYRYNGGIKLLVNWMKTLESRSIETRLMTFDGSFGNWMEYSPKLISYEELLKAKESGRRIVFVTSWLLADCFIELADRIYFYDCELAYTCGSNYSTAVSGSHYGKLKKLLKRRKIASLATHSRTQHAWYLTKFGINPALIPIWIEHEVNESHPEKPMAPIQIGYMNENSSVPGWIAMISEHLQKSGIEADLVEVRGDERQCTEILKRCAIYLGLNSGKSPVFGEGSPLPPLEAMCQGAAVVAFDVKGNREYLFDFYNGYVIESGRIESMIEKLLSLCQDVPKLKEFQSHALGIGKAFSNDQLKWERVSNFLDIKQSNV